MQDRHNGISIANALDISVLCYRQVSNISRTLVGN